jgi:hypothetical protein
MRIAALSTIVLALSVTTLPAQDPGTSYRFRVQLDSTVRSLTLLRDFDIPSACCGQDQRHAGQHEVEVIVMPAELARFKALGLPHQLLDRGRPFAQVQAERLKNAPPGPLAPDARYYTSQEIQDELLRLEQQYPAIAQRVDITAYTGSAATHENRHIYALKISDNVATDEDEPTALIAAQHHARELNSPHMVIGAARRILAGYANDPAIQKTVDEYELWLVPCVNPDGTDYCWTNDNYWRKNRRDNGGNYGVDLNRNYPFQWGVCGTSSSRTSSSVYRGPAAGSEPETQTMMALARKERFDKYLDFHSSGQEVLYTYSSCQFSAYAGQGWRLPEQHYRDQLRGAMSYGTRSPSASGEAQEWHHLENNSLSYLTEIGRSFQPVFTETEAEEARVWPGIKLWLGLRPSVRGHIRSLQGNSPLAAEIDPAPALGTDQGERSRAAANGRYHLWLPPGTFKLPVSAPGHVATTLEGTAPALGQSLTLDLIMVPDFPSATLSGPAQHKMGTQSQLRLQTGSPGQGYWIPFALSTQPGISVGPRTLPLSGDALFFLSANPVLPGIYSGHLGRLDASGNATANFSFPPLAGFAGLHLYFVGITFGPGLPGDVETWSSPLQIQLTN